MKMTTCRDCCIPMVNAMSFSKDKHERFCKCPKCHEETKHTKIKYEDLDFRELLHREINRK